MENKNVNKAHLAKVHLRLSWNTILVEVKRNLNYAKNMFSMGIALMEKNANLLMENMSSDAIIMLIIDINQNSVLASSGTDIVFMGRDAISYITHNRKQVSTVSNG